MSEYEDYLIREQTGEYQGLELHWCSKCEKNEDNCTCNDEEEEKKEIGLRFENASIWDGIPKLKWKDGGAFYDPKDTKNANE